MNYNVQLKTKSIYKSGHSGSLSYGTVVINVIFFFKLHVNTGHHIIEPAIVFVIELFYFSKSGPQGGHLHLTVMIV